MPSFTGKFRYQGSDGALIQAGPCTLTFDEETLTLVPVAGAPIALDLGDIDAFTAGDYDLTLALYTKASIILDHIGKTFQNLCHDFLEAYRKRLVQCLLLEDLEEIARFEGYAQYDSARATFSSPAQFRLYKSNLAVLPTQATGFQWRLADIDAVCFDEADYALSVQCGDGRLTVRKLAKRTREFQARLQEAITQLGQRTAEALHSMFPFLAPGQFQRVALLMKEGCAVPLARLRAIHPRIEQSLLVNCIDANLKPYFDALQKHALPGSMHVGFKLLRAEDESAMEGEGQDGGDGAAGEGTGDGLMPVDSSTEAEALPPASEQTEAAPEQKQALVHWFFFPLATQPGTGLPANLVAWEATTKSGRATYFFRLLASESAAELGDSARGPSLIEAAIQQLNRAIVLLNFRRQPIYLPDDALQFQPRYHRYVIACRKIPELKRLRASFLGRAIHTSPAEWQKQFATFLVGQ
jgi:hypothetical protein